MKLEFGVLADRAGDATDDFLWLEDGHIVGFLGLYQYGPSELEICGMVRPERRRQGIFTGLLDRALEEVQARGAPTALLIVDRSCAAGAGFARSRNAVLARSEYRMLQARPGETAPGREVRLRESEPADYGFIAECLGRAFGEPQSLRAPGDDLPEHVVARARRSLVVEVEGEPVGALTLEHEGTSAGIYGFGLLPERQGEGIGRAALIAATQRARLASAETVHLEVAVDNPAALHLYESCGFDVLGVEDYYSMTAASGG